MARLQTRDIFRESVFARDNNQCVICKKPAVDAHHIMERRLFQEVEEVGGYFLDNGASLCEEHHIKAETTEITPQELRIKCGIEKIILPSHLYDDMEYDKWGNIVLPNGTRYKGELFNDESVQKIIKDYLPLFSKYIKYPRTWHLPWSKMLKDDRQMKDDSHFHGKKVVVTLKMDGENSTLYNDYTHARSIDGNSHPTRNWLKGWWSQISYLIDDNMRLCGENLYAKHSIEYEDLESYFYLFSIWIDMECLSWEETVDYAKIFGCPTVPVIFEGIYDQKKIIDSFLPYEELHEGYVVRISDSFLYKDFRKSINKFVRPAFRQKVNDSHGHWISKKIEKNKLKNENVHS